MEFMDRVSAYPNRYLLTDENSRTSYVYLERADVPTIPGTPLNAETFNRMREEIDHQSGVESTEHPGCYYRMVDGEQEWENPPLVPGVFYRTTERFNSKPVYTVAVDCKGLPDLGEGSTGKKEIWVERPTNLQGSEYFTPIFCTLLSEGTRKVTNSDGQLVDQHRRLTATPDVVAYAANYGKSPNGFHIMIRSYMDSSYLTGIAIVKFFFNE